MMKDSETSNIEALFKFNITSLSALVFLSATPNDRKPKHRLLIGWGYVLAKFLLPIGQVPLIPPKPLFYWCQK